nr:unnamed protein product [Callosobruchus chinensis]
MPKEQTRAIRLISNPALTYHLQPLSHRRAVGDLSLFYLQRKAIRFIGDPALTCHLQPLSPACCCPEKGNTTHW